MVPEVVFELRVSWRDAGVKELFEFEDLIGFKNHLRASDSFWKISVNSENTCSCTSAGFHQTVYNLLFYNLIKFITSYV